MKEIEEFLKEQKAYDKAENTLKGYSKTLKSFDTFTKKPLAKINSKDILNFIGAPEKAIGRKRKHGTLKLSSKKLMLNQLHKYFDWSMETKGLISNPVTRIRKEISHTKMKKEITEILSVEQISKLIKMVFNPHERIILILLYKTGIREGELRNIDIDDINDQDQSIKITLKEGSKTGERIVYLDTEGWQALQDWLNIRKTIDTKDKALIITQRKKRISNLHIWQIVKKYGELAHKKFGDKQYQNLHPHIFRHCYTSHLANNRIHVKALQLLRGDSDKSMVDLYSHLSNEQVRYEYLKAIPKIF